MFNLTLTLIKTPILRRWKWRLTDSEGVVVGRTCRSFKNKRDCLVNVLQHENMDKAQRRMELA